MHDDEQTAARVRAILEPLVSAPGGVRDLALRAALSEPTIRKIASTGLINSHRTASAMQAATNGLINANSCTQSTARGIDFYKRNPARDVLARASDLGIGPTEMLASIGITPHDLWIFMNTPDHQNADVKKRVKHALEAAGITTAVEPAP